MSKAFYDYECDQCGQTTTDEELKLNDVIDLTLPCWQCSGTMIGYINYDESVAKEPKVVVAGDNKIKITSL